MAEETKLPMHIALIPDGNRRWAKERGLSSREGYEAGLRQIIKIINSCKALGVKILTGWALSTDNWKRDVHQVKELINAFEAFLRRNKKMFEGEGIKVRFLGRRDRLPQALLRLMKEIEGSTAKNSKFTVNFAVDYGGRDELKRLICEVAQKVKQGQIPLNSITEDLISEHLDTGGFPDPDLVIRTSGEFRLSGYLPWQTTYAEFVSIPVNFPDFTPSLLQRALKEYGRRKRRFGGGK